MSRRKHTPDYVNIIPDLWDRIKVVPDTRRGIDVEWIPVGDERAEYPCIACDSWGNTPFIPESIVSFQTKDGQYRCFDGKYYRYDQSPEEFMEGQEFISKSGTKWKMPPREIIAWIPLPRPYRRKSQEDNFI